MLPPAMPNPDLSVEPVFRPRYAKALAEAPQRLDDNDRLLLQLQSALPRVNRNRYNIEVLLSIAHWERSFMQMILAVAEAEDLLVEASKAERPVELLGRARDKVRATLDDMADMFQRLKAVWEKSRFEKGRSVGGRDFVHIMDDVKDHLADRRPDLSYLMAPMETIGLPAWLESLEKIIAAQ